jgi:hypothetical protein
VYHATRLQATIPPDLARRIERVRLAQEFPGWTLEYIDSLTLFARADIWGVIEGQRKAEQDRANAAAARRKHQR